MRPVRAGSRARRPSEMAMAKIRLLPPEVAQKIAAGEVIERPFSVVKELVENALDAGASEVRVELLAGGKKLIRVQDNGSGMGPEDASQCFARHATSKIAAEADLERIATLGFRGEALASIAAVSELILRTSEGGPEPGIRIERRGGELVSVRETAFPRGTSVEVANLFFNLPARRKFLRSDQSELGLATRFLASVALAYPEVRFSLIHGQREVLNCPPVGSLRERIFQLYGKDTLERVMEIDFSEGENRVCGFGSQPPSGRSDKARQLFFVNRRPVKDRALQAALNQAYRKFLEKDLFPEAYIFLSVPFADVDVNVHPAKAEVRFRDSQFIFYLVLRAIEKAALAAGGVKGVYLEAAGQARGAIIRESDGRAPGAAAAEGTSQPPLFSVTGRSDRDRTWPRLLGQYLDTYIIAAGEDGLLVIDQHNAHERVLFEQYQEISAAKRWPQKAALLPVLLDLSPSQVINLESSRPVLEEAGFRVEPMGERTFALTAFPDIFGAEEAQRAFLDILGELGEEREPGRRAEKLLATLACHTAIKAHQVLPREQMEYLIERLFQTANPAVCPHGRPILVKLEKSQIEKGLKRIS
jgi:DNA mismatch repair protein MutL